MKKRLLAIFLPALLVCVGLAFTGCNIGLLPGQRYFTVVGGSMAASGIKEGDRIIVEEVLLSKIEVGDIIVFYRTAENPTDTDGSKENALNFRTGMVEYDLNVNLHKIYKIQYDTLGNTWFYTYGTSNIKDSTADPENIEAYYYVDTYPTRGDYVIGRYLKHASGFKVSFETPNIGGTITFHSVSQLNITATDVYCQVETNINGAKDEYATYNLSVSPSYSDETPWQVEDLTFDGTDISVQIKVTNQSTDRNLIATLSDNNDYNNKTVFVGIMDYEFGDEQEIAPSETVIFTVVFPKENYSENIITFNLDLTLNAG